MSSRRAHAGGVQALARDRDGVEQARDQPAQALELQLAQALARRALDVRDGGCVHPSGARGWR